MTNLDYTDIDMYGEETASGVAKEYNGADAIKNAFKNYLLSDPGDFLYYPYTGGVIQQVLHKNMTASILSSLTMSIQRQIEKDFTGIQINVLQFIPDYEIGAVQFYVDYSIAGVSQTVSLFFDQKLTEQIKYEYTYIEYVGENLYNFCVNKKPDMASEVLGIDSNLNAFRWGEYVFKNFTPADEYFIEILALCGA